MTRQPAWTDPHGLTHFRDQFGQVGRHKPGATCGCGPQMVPQEPTDAPQTARDAQGGTVVTGATRGRETANPALLPTPGLYGVMSVEKLARVLSNPDRITAGGRRRAERILADPGPLLEVLAEAGVLRHERCCDAAHREMEDHGGTRVYVCDGPCERSRYGTEWRPTDARA